MGKYGFMKFSETFAIHNETPQILVKKQRQNSMMPMKEKTFYFIRNFETKFFGKKYNIWRVL